MAGHKPRISDGYPALIGQDLVGSSRAFLLVKLSSVQDWITTGWDGPVQTLGQPGLKSKSWAHFYIYIFCIGFDIVMPVLL